MGIIEVAIAHPSRYYKTSVENKLSTTVNDDHCRPSS